MKPDNFFEVGKLYLATYSTGGTTHILITKVWGENFTDSFGASYSAFTEGDNPNTQWDLITLKPQHSIVSMKEVTTPTKCVSNSKTEENK